MKLKEQVVKLFFYSGLMLPLFLLSENAYAADIQTILRNLSNIIVPLTAMVLIASYIAGVFFIFQGLLLMKKFGTTGMTQAQSGELAGPLLKIIIGAILIYLPTSTDVLMNSLFSTSNSLFGGGGTVSLSEYQGLSGTGSSLLGYNNADALSATWQSLANTLVLFIQFLGLISFLKGWFILSHSAGQGSQPGSFGKGLTHIIGGIIALNFVGVVKLVQNTVMGTG